MSEYNGRPLNIAVLIKQIPRADALDLNDRGYLKREGVAVEINPYCRRALTQGILLAKASGGQCHAFSMGPETSEHALREALAAGADSATLISDLAMAGSDTLATAKTLQAALSRKGSFDLILTGLNSVDADTGQVPGQLAQLLGLPFLSGIKSLLWGQGVTHTAWLEQDRKGVTVEFSLPCVMSCAERLCDPIKPSNTEINAIEHQRVDRLSAADLGPGPWGQDLSPTQVGDMKKIRHPRRCGLRFDGTDPVAVSEALSRLNYWGAFSEELPNREKKPDVLDPAARIASMVVIFEPGEWRWGRDLCARARQIARSVTAVLCEPVDQRQMVSLGVDSLLELQGVTLPEQAVQGILQWMQHGSECPGAIIGPSSQWGRHVLARLAAATGSGLTGDAVGLRVDSDGRMVADKPAFCGKLNSAIVYQSKIQMATVREGVFQHLAMTPAEPQQRHSIEVAALQNGLKFVRSEQLDQPVDLYGRDVLIGIGQGVDPEDYTALEPLKKMLAAEFVATRKVTDYGWLPRARQVGLTGKTIAPRLYIAVGLSGRPYHAISIQNSRWIVAVNNDPYAPIFDHADICLIGDWKKVITRLTQAIRSLNR